MFNIKQNLAKKVDVKLKPSHLKEVTIITHLVRGGTLCPPRPCYFSCHFFLRVSQPIFKQIVSDLVAS